MSFGRKARTPKRARRVLGDHRISPQIEHRLFSAISLNWRGRPLTSREVIVELIAATSTRTGLKVRAELDTGDYPKGTKITDKELAALPITKHEFHGEWNYSVSSRST